MVGLSAQRASEGTSSHAEIPSTVTSLPRPAVPSRLASHLRLMSGPSTALRTPAASKPTTPASNADRTRRRLPSLADALSTRSKRSNVGRGTSRSLASALSCGLPLLEPRCPEICTFFEPIPGCREAVEGASCRRGSWSRGRERQRRAELSLRVDAGNSDPVPGLDTQLEDCWQDNDAAVDLGSLFIPDRSSQVARWPTYGSRQRQGHKTTGNPDARGRLAARPSDGRACVALRPSDTGRAVTVRNDDAPARYSHPFQNAVGCSSTRRACRGYHTIRTRRRRRSSSSRSRPALSAHRRRRPQQQPDGASACSPASCRPLRRQHRKLPEWSLASRLSLPLSSSRAGPAQEEVKGRRSFSSASCALLIRCVAPSGPHCPSSYSHVF